MKQIYDHYTNESQEVWQILFQRQEETLQDKACGLYLECLRDMQDVLHGEAIPRFEELDRTLLDTTAWSIEVVKGLIPAEDFLSLLQKRRFCSSTWVRKKSQLDYLEEPDMFHDIFGHIPLFLDPDYSDFMQRLGELSLAYKDHPLVIDQLERIYWYTVEFGLIRENGKRRIYGAGILSSFQESNHVILDEVDVLPFDLADILNRPFDKSDIQPVYFEVESWAQLYDTLNVWEEKYLKVGV
jgi:phenylalanine-4-hydroxylase